MRSVAIRFTRAPQKCVATGRQLFWKAIDLGGDLRVLDVQLSVYALSGGASPKVTISVLTSCHDDADLGWATLGTFTSVDGQAGADQTETMVMVGALRYVRFEVTSLGSGASCYFTIDGQARTHE
jgi:hypothetical protein